MQLVERNDIDTDVIKDLISDCVETTLHKDYKLIEQALTSYYLDETNTLTKQLFSEFNDNLKSLFMRQIDMYLNRELDHE